MVELRYVTRTILLTRIGFDTPGGFIEAQVEWDRSHVGNVTFRNVPTFIYHYATYSGRVALLPVPLRLFAQTFVPDPVTGSLPGAGAAM